MEDKEEILEHIKSIDLDLILHELDVIDPERRRALIEIKDEKVKRKAEKEIEEKNNSLRKSSRLHIKEVAEEVFQIIPFN